MDKKMNLSKNLRAFQASRDASLAEFAAELGIPKSTLQSVMADGNTTLDTAIRLSESLKVPLDELIADEDLPVQLSAARSLLQTSDWLASLPKDRREEVIYHIECILEALKK